jgi:hypothetical protein
MLKFESTRAIPSKLYEGVTFTIKRVTEGRRISFRTENWQYIDRLVDLQTKASPYNSTLTVLSEALKACENDEDKMVILASDEYQNALKELTPLNEEFERIDMVHIRPAYLRTYYASVDGIEIDGVSGKKITSDILLSQGPPELVKEVVDAIIDEIQLSAKEKENLGSPITSDAVDGGPVSDTTASTVAPTVTI